jgi:hypothetical protein
MRIKMLHYAGESIRFGPTAFEKSVGKDLRVNLVDGSAVLGKLVKAVVADDGGSVEFTLELPDVIRPQIDGNTNAE